MSRGSADLTYTSSIADVGFYVLGNEDVKRISCSAVLNPDVMNGDRPMPDGLYDSHMGTTSYEYDCLTCRNRKGVCPGHFGHITLRYPVKSPLYRDELLKWLKIICFYCGALVVKENPSIGALKRLAEYAKSNRTEKDAEGKPICMRCKKPVLSVSRDKKSPVIFYRNEKVADGKVIQTEYLNHQIERVLQMVTDETVLAMGRPLRSHPKKFVLRNIPVPPNTIRPELKKANGAVTNMSDLTTVLKLIQKHNQFIDPTTPTDEKINDEDRRKYRMLDSLYFILVKGSANIADIKEINNMHKPPVSVLDRISSKQGRIRSNLMGKRVEYMIRSVITGDPRLNLDEVGIPKSHAMSIVIPETVNSRNIARLTTYYKNGPKRYPGSTHVFKKGEKQMYLIEYMDKSYQLKEGDQLYRHMIDGDWVIFNRQPSLRFSSMAGMKCVVMNHGDTIRMSPSACIYFNADFDGDSMNLLCCQTIPSSIEIKHVSRFARWVVSLQTMKPFVGSFQDALIGLAELTRSGITFNKWHAMAIMSETRGLDYTFNKSTYTNRELVSRLLPDININGKHPTIYKKDYDDIIHYDPSDIVVNIKRGQLLSGILDKATTGQEQLGSIYHLTASKFGPDAAIRLANNMQQIVQQFMYNRGFTVGVADINIPKEAEAEVSDKIKGILLESVKITNRLNNGTLIAPLGMSLIDYYEAEQINALNLGDDCISIILRNIDLNTNGIAKLIMTGSKGKEPNFMNINAAIGLQKIGDRRFQPQLGVGRVSPYTFRYDTDPEANGFIATSYKQGISSKVYPYIAGESRNGMIANALSTAVTGDQNRKYIKNLESAIVDNYRKTAKRHCIVQFLYAELGVDISKMQRVKFNTMYISDEAFKAYRFNPSSVTKLSKRKNTNGSDSKTGRSQVGKLDTLEAIADCEFAQLTADREEYRKIHLSLENYNPKEYISDVEKFLPVDVKRIIGDLIEQFGSKQEDEFDPWEEYKQVVDMVEQLPYVYYNDAYRLAGGRIAPHIASACKLVIWLVRSHLCLSQLQRLDIRPKLLSIILDTIQYTYKRTLIDYGTAVGILAAQCISEPLTQSILNSKHKVGGQGGTRTNEIDRLKEIFGAKGTDKMKNPHMLIIPKAEYIADKNKVQQIANCLEMLFFGQFVNSTHIFFEEFGKPTHPRFKHEAAEIKDIVHNLAYKPPNNLAKWCVRFGINKEELVLKNMQLETLVLAITRQLPSVYVIYSPENSDNVYVRCYLRTKHFKESKEFYSKYVTSTMEEIKDTVVRGIRGILNTQVIEFIRNMVQPDGSVERKKTYGIACVGSNLVEVIKHRDVDPYLTQTDSIEEIESLYGIGACRAKILNETLAAMGSLNQFHCTVFADEMCFSGVMTSIQLTGLQKRETANVCLRMSFQKPLQVLQEACIAGMSDKISGISANLLLGGVPKCGTTYNSIGVNRAFIAESNKNVQDAIDNL